jgi:hypothetical protein
VKVCFEDARGPRTRPAPPNRLSGQHEAGLPVPPGMTPERAVAPVRTEESKRWAERHIITAGPVVFFELPKLRSSRSLFIDPLSSGRPIDGRAGAHDKTAKLVPVLRRPAFCRFQVNAVKI